MICPQCNVENKDGAGFCIQCGAKLIEAPDTSKAEAAVENVASDVKEVAENVTSEVKTAADEVKDEFESAGEESTTVLTADMLDGAKSEESTTVLTADMLNQNSSNSGTLVGGPQGAVGAQPNGMAMQQGRPMGMQPGMSMQQGRPMGMQPGMTQQQMNRPEIPQKAQKPGKTPKAPKPEKAPKPVKEAKQPKQKSGKMGGGMIAYIVISLILILGMAGVGVWGYLHYTKKIDNLTNDKDAVSKELESTKAMLDSRDEEIAGLDTANSDLEDEVSSLQSQVADYEAQVSELSSANDKYAPLVNFANDSATGQGHDDFFASDSVVHLKGDTKSVKVFFEPEDGTVNPAIADGGVATCSWQDGWGETGYVATLDIAPVATGTTTLTLTNDVNDEKITILVIVD